MKNNPNYICCTINRDGRSNGASSDTIFLLKKEDIFNHYPIIILTKNKGVGLNMSNNYFIANLLRTNDYNLKFWDYIYHEFVNGAKYTVINV